MTPLATGWEQRNNKYDFVVIGSGYGGAITAARLSSANLNPKPSVCILERGREWQPGEFPETLGDVVTNARSDTNPLGLRTRQKHALHELPANGAKRGRHHSDAGQGGVARKAEE